MEEIMKYMSNILALFLVLVLANTFTSAMADEVASMEFIMDSDSPCEAGAIKDFVKNGRRHCSYPIEDDPR